MIGELDAGNPHVQFDEGAQETCDIAARLCPTLPQPLAMLSRRQAEVLKRLKPARFEEASTPGLNDSRISGALPPKNES